MKALVAALVILATVAAAATAGSGGNFADGRSAGANDEAAYLAQVLGHGRQDMQGGGKIADFMTPQSYNSDWKVSG